MIHNFYQNIKPFKGKLRLGRLIFKLKIQKSKDITITAKNNLKYSVPNLKENISEELFLNGIYEEKTIEHITKIIPKNGVMMDIGANIGAISVAIAKKRPDIKIIAVEASPNIFQYLKKNIELNQISNIIAINKVISDVSGQTLKFYAPKDKFGKGSLQPIFTNVFEEVLSTTLDEISLENNLLSLDLIKIDVEGYEKIVFDCAQKTLVQFKPIIAFEFVDWAENLVVKAGDAQKLLKYLGYDIFLLEGQKYKRIDSILYSGSADLWAIYSRT